MERLEAYDLINKCETFEELADAILVIGKDNNSLINGRKFQFKATDQANVARNFKNITRAEYLTRSYGIRQQALYILHYEQRESKE